MPKKNKRFERISSRIVAFLFFAWLGWIYIFPRVLTPLFEKLEFIVNSDITLYSSIAVMGIIGLLLSLKMPRFIEIFIAGFCVLIIVQFFWDFGAKDMSDWRVRMFIGSVIFLILDIFFGFITLKGVRKISLRQLGYR